MRNSVCAKTESPTREKTKKEETKENGKGAQAAAGGDLDERMDDGEEFLLVSCGFVRCGRYIRYTIDDCYLSP